MVNIVADLGNSRLKWARVESGTVLGTRILPIDELEPWAALWDEWDLSSARSSWAISSVNPPVAARLRDFLEKRRVSSSHWYCSAAEVPVRHELGHPETAGADRALAVLAAQEIPPTGRPRLVVSCGSAVVVDRVSPAGTWQGGAIAPGLGLSARALHFLTAQLPMITVSEAPPAWGASTEPALASGLFWGTVGAIREILQRQAEGLSPPPCVFWTGGEAQLLAPWVAWEGSRTVPDLVLIGLAQAAFGIAPKGPAL
jgi:type III pantothenate kinase